MKKIIKKPIMLLFFLSVAMIQNAFGFDLSIHNPNLEIRSFMRGYINAMEEDDIEKIKSFYDKDYKSTDGLNLDDVVKMMEKTHDTYKNIKYKTKINSINVYDSWALVRMSDKTNAVIYPVLDKKLKKEKQGDLEGKSVYDIYLKKNIDGWKIVKDDVLMEETTLKYGVARKIDINLITPYEIKNNEEYDLSLQLGEVPTDLISLASISREEITYPPQDYDEKYRKISSQGALERLVKANDKNVDEYAIASIGFTRVTANEEMTKARIEVLGMAYMIKRVNMERSKALKIDNPKEDEKTQTINVNDSKKS